MASLVREQSQTLRNVVFIGETGSGKSSVINLIADRNVAVVSPDATPCTADFIPYNASIKGRTYRLWDTPGLNKPSGFRLFGRRATKTTGSLKRFLRERYRCGELDLLVFCVQGGRANKAMSEAYKMFCSPTRQMAIPVVIAITHLERIQPTMETWWSDNERALGDLGFTFEGYACLTCVSPHHRRWSSQQDIHVLISKEYPRRTLSTLSDREYLTEADGGCVVC